MPMRKRTVDRPHPPLTLNLKPQTWDQESIPTMSEHHYGHRSEYVNLDQRKIELAEISRFREFKKTPSKKPTGNIPIAIKRGESLAVELFDRYINSINLLSHVPPYDYRLAVCNAVGEIPLLLAGGEQFSHPDVIAMAATICWIKLTELIDGLIGEPLDPDYIRYLDRQTLKVRLRRVGSYAELLYAYDYTTVLDTVYPVEDPARWAKFPQSWGELMFCYLWRREQSQFFRRLTHYSNAPTQGNQSDDRNRFYY